MKRPYSLQIQPDVGDDLWQFYRQRDFTGGENKMILPEFMGPNQLVSATNTVLSVDGVPETRKGKTPINTNVLGTGGITSIHRYSKLDGSQYILVQQGTNLYSVSWDGTADIPSFGEPIAEDLDTAKLRSAVWKDLIFFTNGEDTPFYYDGSDVTDLTDAPKSPAFYVYGGRLWGWEGNTLEFSDLEDYTTWDALNVINVRDGDGDRIAGLSLPAGGMVIFKTRSVWPLYGTSNSDFRLPETPLYDDDGAVNTDCILDMGLFLGHEGFYQFDLTGVTPIFSSHKSVIRALTLTQKQQVIASTDPIERRLLFHLPTGYTLCIQEQENPSNQSKYYSVSTLDALNIGCFCIANDKDDTGKLIIGDADAGWLYYIDNETDDNGTAIVTSIQTAYNDYGIIAEKIFRRVTPEMDLVNQSDELAYEETYDVDYGLIGETRVVSEADEDALIWDQGNWDEKLWGGYKRMKEPFNIAARGNRISYSWRTSVRIKFQGYIAKYMKVAIK